MVVCGKILVGGLLTIIPLLCAAVKIQRDITDTMFDTRKCTKRSVRRGSSCVCDTAASTVMTRSGEKASCSTPQTLGCDYADIQTGQAFFVDDNVYNIRVSQGIRKQSCRLITRVYVWNLLNLGLRGKWIDITTETKGYFGLRNIKRQPWDAHLFLSKEKRQFLSGHMLKIEFGTAAEYCGNCLAVKFKGTKTYPMDLDNFRSNFDVRQIPTTLARTTAETSKTTTGVIRTTAKPQTKVVTMLTTSAPVVIKTTAKPVTKLITTLKVQEITKRHVKTNRKMTHTSPTVRVTTKDYTIKTNSNVVVTEILTKKDVITKDLSVTMTALISGIFAMLTIALFLLVLFCRRRYRNNPKLKMAAGEMLNENGGQFIGTSTKSKSFEWDAVKLIPSRSPTASQHSSRHYENCELEPTKYDAITKEYDFDNYECIFGTRKFGDNEKPLVAPDYAEIRPDYENYNALEEENPTKRKKQRSNKSSLKEKQDNPHEYSDVTGEDAVYETFDINQTLKYKQLPTEDVQLHPHQYAEIDDHMNDGDYTELNREGSINKYDSLQDDSSIKWEEKPSVTYDSLQDSDGPITLQNGPLDDRANSSNTPPPPQYETINIENDNSKLERKNRKQCSTKSRERFHDDANLKQYNDVIQRGENSVIKSVVKQHGEGGASNSDISDCDLDGNRQQDTEFSNPSYEEHLMIAPDRIEDDDTATHSYENNPVNISNDK